VNLLPRATLAALLSAATLLAAPAAFAHGTGVDPAPVPTPPAGDGRKAFEVVAEVEKDVAARGEKKEQASAIVKEAIHQVKKSLDRARGADSAGDSKHGRMLGSLALEWAEIAKDLLRAVDAEQKAREAEQKLKDKRAQTERARALLAETQARLERAKGELDKAQTEAEDMKKRAAEAEDERLKGKGKGKGNGKGGKGK